MFSITELAKKHGFEPIRARRYFMAGGHYAGAEVALPMEKGLTPGVSTFGGELMKNHTLESAGSLLPGKIQNTVYGKKVGGKHLTNPIKPDIVYTQSQ